MFPKGWVFLTRCTVLDSRTSFGGPFAGYYEALENLGAEYVRMAPGPSSARRLTSMVKRSERPGATSCAREDARMRLE